MPQHTAREQERKRKLAQKPTVDPFVKDTEDKARQKARDKRDRSVNNSRTRAQGLAPVVGVAGGSEGQARSRIIDRRVTELQQGKRRKKR